MDQTTRELLIEGAKKITRLDNQVAALEEAICPRVAARLTALEKQVGFANSNARVPNTSTQLASLMYAVTRLVAANTKVDYCREFDLAYTALVDTAKQIRKEQQAAR